MDFILKVTQHWLSQEWDDTSESCLHSIICNICNLGCVLKGVKLVKPSNYDNICVK
jgi:hypothetical protein